MATASTSKVTGAPVRAHAGHSPLFEGDSTRKHRFLIRDDGPAIVRKVASASGTDMVLIGIRGVPLTADEEACSEAFGSASVEWLASRSSTPLPPEDVEWFGSRPGRRHRIRPALASEREGRGPAQWATIVALAGGCHLRLCLDEATLPRGDRGEEGLARILSARAAALASGHALDLTHRQVTASAAQGSKGLEAFSVKPDARVAKPAPKVASAHRGVTERWKDKVEARPEPAKPWPTLSLPAALDVTRRLRSRYGRGPIRLYDLRATLGEDVAAATVTALKAFGLVTVGSDGMSRLTQSGVDAVDGCPRATSAAATTPALYKAIVETCGTEPTLEEMAASAPLRGHPTKDVNSMHGLFIETMRLAAEMPA